MLEATVGRNTKCEHAKSVLTFTYIFLGVVFEFYFQNFIGIYSKYTIRNSRGNQILYFKYF